MKSKFLIVFVCCITLAVLHSNGAPIDAGKSIFSSRCMACHKIDVDFAGPALANVDKRHTIDWIIKFVHSSQTVIKSGDTSATALFSKFNGTIMPDHPDLSDNDIKSIVAFIKDESAKVVIAKKKPFERPYEFQPNYSPINMQNSGFLVLFIASVLLLILTLLFAVEAKQIERNMHKKL